MAARFPRGKQHEFPMHCIGTRKLRQLFECNYFPLFVDFNLIWSKRRRANTPLAPTQNKKIKLSNTAFFYFPVTLKMGNQNHWVYIKLDSGYHSEFQRSHLTEHHLRLRDTNMKVFAEAENVQTISFEYIFMWNKTAFCCCFSLF